MSKDDMEELVTARRELAAVTEAGSTHAIVRVEHLGVVLAAVQELIDREQQRME